MVSALTMRSYSGPFAASTVSRSSSMRSSRKHGMGQCAHMQMTAVPEFTHHQFVETRRDAVKHFPQGKIRNTADSAQLEKNEKTVVLGRGQIGLDSQRAVVALRGLLEAAHGHKDVSAVVPGNCVI